MSVVVSGERGTFVLDLSDFRAQAEELFRHGSICSIVLLQITYYRMVISNNSLLELETCSKSKQEYVKKPVYDDMTKI